MKTPARTSSGVTLIELLVVIVVLALLATMAGPAYERQLSAKRLNGSATLLITDLHNARSQAVVRNAVVQVQLSGTSYTLRTPPGSSGSTLRTVTLPQGVTLSAGTSTEVSFDPVRGTAGPYDASLQKVSPATTELTLTHSDHSLRLSVHPFGRVQCTVLSGSASC